jgi:hypothetical protein
VFILQAGGIVAHLESIVETKADFMVVRIRFGRGPVVTRRRGKNSRIATFAASLLTLGSISCASLGVWRLGADLGWMGEFAFARGLFSHWQVWISGAAAAQYAGWRLNRYAKIADRRVSAPLPDVAGVNVRTPANV